MPEPASPAGKRSASTTAVPSTRHTRGLRLPTRSPSARCGGSTRDGRVTPQLSTRLRPCARRAIHGEGLDQASLPGALRRRARGRRGSCDRAASGPGPDATSAVRARRADAPSRRTLTPAPITRTPIPPRCRTWSLFPPTGSERFAHRGQGLPPVRRRTSGTAVPLPLVVEGFRASGEDRMDAYQYFLQDGVVVGRAPWARSTSTTGRSPALALPPVRSVPAPRRGAGRDPEQEASVLSRAHRSDRPHRGRRDLAAGRLGFSQCGSATSDLDPRGPAGRMGRHLLTSGCRASPSTSPPSRTGRTGSRCGPTRPAGCSMRTRRTTSSCAR